MAMVEDCALPIDIFGAGLGFALAFEPALAASDFGEAAMLAAPAAPSLVERPETGLEPGLEPGGDDLPPREAGPLAAAEQSWQLMTPPVVEKEAFPIDLLQVLQIKHSMCNFPKAQDTIASAITLPQALHESPCFSRKQSLQ